MQLLFCSCRPRYWLIFYFKPKPIIVNIQETNTPADISAYLAKVESLSPTKVLNTNNFSDSLAGAFSGNTAGIISVRANLTEYEQALLAIPVPPSAVQHMTLLVSITRFLNDRMNTIEQNGQTDPTKAYIATRELQEGLPPNIVSLNLQQQNLVGLSQ